MTATVPYGALRGRASVCRASQRGKSTAHVGQVIRAPLQAPQQRATISSASSAGRSVGCRRAISKSLARLCVADRREGQGATERRRFASRPEGAICRAPWCAMAMQRGGTGIGGGISANKRTAGHWRRAGARRLGARQHRLCGLDSGAGVGQGAATHRGDCIVITCCESIAGSQSRKCN